MVDELTYLINRGDIIQGSILVDSNVFNIPERIRDIDPDYFVIFNPKTQKYELHHRKQDVSFCVEFPFDELDGRAVEYVNETKIERIRSIKRQMEEKNRLIEEGQNKEFTDKVECMAKDIHKYARSHEDDEQKEAFKNAYSTN